MGKRRANNEGSLYRRKNGLWCAQVSLDGQRITKYARTQKECQLWIRETLDKIECGLTFAGTRITLEQFIESWMSGKQLSTRERTLHQYRQITDDYIIPSLGKMRIRTIKPVHIRRMYLHYQEAGAGERTLQLVHPLLHNILGQAIREGLLSRNPTTAVQRPKRDIKEGKILTEAQARQLLIAASGTRNEALFFLALTTGMRQGELLGLKWSDLDWEKGTLHVQRQLQRIDGKGLVFMPPKTKAGKRQIRLGQGMLERLANHRKRQEQEREELGERWRENDLVFPSTIGTPMELHRIYDEFKALLKKAGLPDIRFHDLRHTAISLLIEMGVSVTTIQQRAGHSKASVTTDIYGHSPDRAQQRAASKIEELIAPITVDFS